MTKAVCLFLTAALGMAADSSTESVFQAIRNNRLSEIRNLKDVNVKDDRGITALMYCAYAGSPEAMRILIDKGADVNAKNAFDSTALMWSVAEMPKVRMLVEKGADVNAVSKLGRTAVMLAAMRNESAETVRYLVSKGANLKTVDALRTTMLNAAAQGGDLETIRMMIDAVIDVNAADVTGPSPLLYAAANGNTEAVKLLLSKGADVNFVSAGTPPPVKAGKIALGKFTALELAAPTGPPELIKALLDAGADVNAKDARGMTPLMLAVATDHGSNEIVKMLLDKGADRNAKSALGETAGDWAKKFGPTETARMFGVASSPPAQPIAAVSLDPKTAVERSLALLDKAGAQFFLKGGCSSCHSQNIVDIATEVARRKGIAVDEKQTADRQKLNRAFFGSMIPNLLEHLDPPGATDLIVYAVAGMAASGMTPDRMTDGIVADLAAQQLKGGNWHFVLNIARPPIEDGDFFRTALGIRALQVYGPPGRHAEMAERIDRAKQWLLLNKPRTAEDRNYQLLGVKWAGADDATLRRLAQVIIGYQRPDGGWAQTHELASDALGTGQTLYALAESGAMSPKEPVFEKGVRYLLATQKPDGSWFVKSRAPKFQPYFESGFPYGHDQWISSMATGWATAALAHAVEPVVKRAAE